MSDQMPKSGLVLRRRNKVVGFLIFEGSAIGLLLISGTCALLLRHVDPNVTLTINVATIAAAAAAAIIPIIFFAIAPVLPHDDRRS
jgi:hypothetical protein